MNSYGVLEEIDRYEPITISGYYDGDALASPPLVTWTCTGSSNEGGTMSEIGGTNCHLCGSEREYANTYTTYKKNGAKTEHCIHYKCGTHVDVSAKGKKSVVVGDDCIQLG